MICVDTTGDTPEGDLKGHSAGSEVRTVGSPRYSVLCSGDGHSSVLCRAYSTFMARLWG